MWVCDWQRFWGTCRGTGLHQYKGGSDGRPRIKHGHVTIALTIERDWKIGKHLNGTGNLNSMKVKKNMLYNLNCKFEHGIRDPFTHVLRKQPFFSPLVWPLCHIAFTKLACFLNLFDHVDFDWNTWTTCTLFCHYNLSTLMDKTWGSHGSLSCTHARV